MNTVARRLGPKPLSSPTHPRARQDVPTRWASRKAHGAMNNERLSVRTAEVHDAKNNERHVCGRPRGA